MCKIRYIQREGDIVKKDCTIRMDNKEFDLVDKPYYIVKDENADSVSFMFHYLDVNEETTRVSENSFTLKYGTKTGRLLSLDIKRSAEEWVKLELWTSFGKVLMTSIQRDNLRKVHDSFEIIQRLYFNKYEEVEQEGIQQDDLVSFPQ